MLDFDDPTCCIFFTVGEVQYVEMFETPDGKSRGSGYICFIHLICVNMLLPIKSLLF